MPQGQGRHQLFTELRADLKAADFELVAPVMLKDSECGGRTSRLRVAILAEDSVAHFRLPPLDLGRAQRVTEAGCIRDALRRGGPRQSARPLAGRGPLAGHPGGVGFGAMPQRFALCALAVDCKGGGAGGK
jgi:hypothetical protein